MIDIAQTPTGYTVKFAYKPYLVDSLKQRVHGGRYNPKEKTWWFPSSAGASLQSWASQHGGSIRAAVLEQIGEEEPLPELEVSIPLLRDLFYYQTKGVAYLLKHNRTIIGDQPGLGKTAQAIAASVANESKCILVICPATLRENWRREWKMWTGWNAMIMSDRIKTTWKTYYDVGMTRVFICNYESLKKYYVEKIDKPEGKPLRLNHIKFRDTILTFDTIIIDESHRCKDGRTKQAKFCMGIAKGKKNVFLLTGTPVVNKPMDLISQLHIINMLDVFGGYKGFVDTYCQGYNEASNLQHLNFLLKKNCFYRRDKKDVLKDLPDKIRSIYTCEIENRAEYDKAQNNLEKYLRENLGRDDQQISRSLRGEVMVILALCKKLAARGKINDVVEHVREVVDAGEKIVIFAWHKEIVQELKSHLPGAVTIVGDDSMDQRQSSVDRFQNDPNVKVCICNIKSGGVGITLTASSRVGFIELPWHPADGDQCEDRCHRIGQKDSVECTYFLGKDTVDEKIYAIIEKKRGMVNQVTGSHEEIETNMIDEFINLFRKQAAE
jgi:SWI/SNF-related matrix-associated actin-dependent regulator 1 of chromatin subfamily A